MFHSEQAKCDQFSTTLLYYSCKNRQELLSRRLGHLHTNQSVNGCYTMAADIFTLGKETSLMRILFSNISLFPQMANWFCLSLIIWILTMTKVMMSSHIQGRSISVSDQVWNSSSLSQQIYFLEAVLAPIHEQLNSSKSYEWGQISYSSFSEENPQCLPLLYLKLLSFL